MCDYSLEMYRNRPARFGERYESHRFPSGSIGFVSPGALDVAVCIACDSHLKLENLDPSLQKGFNLAATETATFTRLDTGPHHDAIRFRNGAEITLQQLGLGVSAHLVEEPVVVAAKPDALVPAELVPAE